jgi:hypothetical protein
MVRVSVCKENNGDFIGRPTDLPQIVLEERGRSPNPCVDQADLVTEKDIRIDKPVCILVLSKGQPEVVFKGVNSLCDFHPRFPP